MAKKLFNFQFESYYDYAGPLSSLENYVDAGVRKSLKLCGVAEEVSLILLTCEDNKYNIHDTKFWSRRNIFSLSDHFGWQDNIFTINNSYQMWSKLFSLFTNEMLEKVALYTHFNTNRNKLESYNSFRDRVTKEFTFMTGYSPWGLLGIFDLTSSVPDNLIRPLQIALNLIYCERYTHLVTMKNNDALCQKYMTF